jgi:hypothetical protein
METSFTPVEAGTPPSKIMVAVFWAEKPSGLVCGSFFRVHLIQGHGGEDDEAFDDLLPERRDLHQDEAVVQHTNDEAAEDGAEHGAAPAAERGAADDDGGDGIEFVANAGVRPHCHYPNLISRFMKLMLGQLSPDWEERWGHPIALVESFVDPRFYQGTAYKVSGWCHLGRSAGWKRDADDFYEKNDAPKQIWVRELVKKACVKLRAPKLPPLWAKVEEASGPHCTAKVGQIHSLMEWARTEIPEFRRAQALGYPVAGLSCLTAMAVAQGVVRGPQDLAQYADTMRQAQLRALRFRYDSQTGDVRCPKKTTFTRFLHGVDEEAIERVLLRWQDQILGPTQDRIVICDGKKVRRGGVEIVNAVNSSGRFLGSVITQSKSNEIPAARQLLLKQDLLGKIVVNDALHTQVETAQQILYEQGGDYLVTVKGNQPTLQSTLEKLFEKQPFSPSTHGADPRDEAGAQPRTAGDSLPGVSGSDPCSGGLPRGSVSGPLGDTRQAQGKEEEKKVVPGGCLPAE